MRTRNIFSAVSALAVLLALPAPTSAQTTKARPEVFVGYSYLPADLNDFPRANSHGFQAAISAPLNPWLSIAFDVGAHYSHADDLGPNFRGVTADSSVYEFLGGPQFTLRRKVSPFVHALAGRAKGHTSLGGFSDSGFALAVGGGADVDINSRYAVRVQIDEIGAFTDILEENLRAGAGLVVRLGR